MNGKAGTYDYFLLKRVQSLFGVFPLAVFLFFHFSLNSFVLSGPETFSKVVGTTQGFPFIVLLEVGLIAIPLLIHILLGLIIIYRGSVNIIEYSYYRNWMYVLQRVTGFAAIAFVVYHVWTTRLYAALTNEHITFLYMQKHFEPTWVQVFYIIGILSSVFHLANGLATALMTWGVTASNRSQLAMAVMSWIITLGMGAWGLRILFAFV